MTKIFSQLTKLARERGLSLTEAADKAGVPLTTLWGWRNRVPKTLQTWERLMQVLEGESNNDAPTPPPVRQDEKPA
jgi:predicted transcriptional regulator